MTKRNPNFSRLSSTYLFPEINRRKKMFLETHPEASLISLGIGDTTEPLPTCISNELAASGKRLGTVEGYSGYGPEQGSEELRKAIAREIYHNKIHADEVFVSDGAKCDIGRLQKLFGPNVSIAVQDPAYPVYVDGSLLQGVTEIIPLPCHADNQFWPDLSKVQRTDLIYWCSPNNRTGAVSTKEQLEQLVAFAKANRSIIIFDSAYANYIQDEALPKSIFEIKGADEVAIEVGSFSKLGGFSGVRLGWTVVPKALKYEDGSSVQQDWKRVVSTIFNGASNIAQQGGLAVLSSEGLGEIQRVINFYLENTRMIRAVLEKQEREVYGGINAPYLWVKFPGKTSWEAFEELLEKSHIVTTPGSGFGLSGEGYLRMSAFGHRSTILQAIERLKVL